MSEDRAKYEALPGFTQCRLMQGCRFVAEPHRHHVPECPRYSTQEIPRLFYWDEGVDAWLPFAENFDADALLDNLDDGEVTELRVRRLLLTDARMDNLQEAS